VSVRPPLPPTKGKDASPDRLNAFITHLFRPNIPYRIGVRRLLNRARLYKGGVQWIEPVLDDGFMSADWTIMQQDDMNGIPMPVQNEIFPLVVREAALIAKVGERPYVRPNKDSPRVTKAAKLAKDVLLSHLEDIAWPDKEREGSTHCATYGQWWTASYMDYDWTKTARVPVEGALACPEAGCDVTFASKELTEEQALKIQETSPDAVAISEGPDPNNQFADPDLSYSIQKCPRCTEHTGFGMKPSFDDGSGMPRLTGSGNQAQEFGQVKQAGAPALVPHDPTEEEYKTGKDFLGKPLGEDLPIGEAVIDNISPFDAAPNPSGQGLDTNPENWEEFAWATPRSLDWIRSRYPENGWKVKAEEGSELWRYHPVLGGLGSAGVTIGAPEFFQNHALVKVFAKRPYMAKSGVDDTEKDIPDEKPYRNHGRLIVMANNVVLADLDFEVESQNNPGTWLPRIHFDWAAWELRDRECFGIGIPECLFSQQDAINTNKSQQMDARHRGANPKWMAEDGVEFTYKGGSGSGYTSDFLTYHKSRADMQPPTPFPGITIPAGVFQEFQNDIEAMPRIVNAAEIEGGDPPGGVEAYSALLLLAQKAADTRKPRNERIRDMKRRIFKHQLELIHEFYRETRVYRVRGSNDAWSVKEFLGRDLVGQTDVRFDVEPVIDVGVAKREGIQLGIRLGTIVADTAPAKRRLNQALEITNEINEDPNQQVDHAENEAIAWADANEEPLIDESGDSDEIHWQQHKEDFGDEEWTDRKKAAQWKNFLRVIWGWDEEFKGLLEQEATFKVSPPVPPPTQMALVPQPGAQEAFLGAQKVYEAQVETMQKIQALPKVMEDRIMAVWKQKLTAASMSQPGEVDPQTGMLGSPKPAAYTPPVEPEATEAFQKCFRFAAHMEAHRVRLEVKAQAANAGIAQAAAPGASMTDQGLVPSAGQAASLPPGGSAGNGSVGSAAAAPPS
jgi:hypothetical protein